MNTFLWIYSVWQLLNKGVMFVLLFFILFLPNCYAANTTQDSINKVMTSLRSKALKYDRKHEIYSAIEYYRRYLVLKSSDTKLSYRLATLYFDVRDYTHANQLYDSVVNHHARKYPLALYHKGLVCMNLGKYDEAEDAFTRFKKIYKVSNDPFSYRKLALIYIESAEWAKCYSENNTEIVITHPGELLNHSNIDFSPFPSDDHTLIFGALNTNKDNSPSSVRQLFKAKKISGQWKSMGLINGEINLPDINTGNAVVSEDGLRLYFTRKVRNWQDKDISEIYVSNFDGTTWLTPVKLPYPINDGNYTSTQPALGRNLKSGNELLYFVSNRPGGRGGLDIWYTEIESQMDTYKKPIDLDKSVNSVGDECSPFYDLSTRTLYFSSRGRKNGLGGYDIYKATGSTRKWTDVLALPKPINSSFDDYYFSILKNNKEGFFTSNRPGSMFNGNGSCCDDIFIFHTNECAKISSWGVVRNSEDIDFYNQLNEKYHLGLVIPEPNIILSDVPVELYLSGEKEGDELLISKTVTNQDGQYNFDLERNKKYKILVKNYGYFEKRVSVNSLGVNCSDTLNIGTTYINYLPKMNVRLNIYYDHDKSKLSDSAKQIIDSTFLPLFDYFPTAIVEIGSHTDSTGVDMYNLKLSQKRSETVVNYLISKGISREHLVAKGYGMRSPIAPNTNPDGTDNPIGRHLNRRTEIRIVGEIKNVYMDE